MLYKSLIKKHSTLIHIIISVIVIQFIIKVTIDYLLHNSIIKDINDVRNVSTLCFAFVYDGTLAILGLLLYRVIGKQNLRNFGLQMCV